MKLSVAVLFLASGGNRVNAFSSFAFANGGSKHPKQGWDPSPFQQNELEEQTSPKFSSSSIGDKDNIIRPPFPSAPTNVNDLSSSINPVPFAATKADTIKGDSFNPLVRPISFTKGTDTEVEGTFISNDAFSAKVSPPKSKQPAASSDFFQSSSDTDSKETSSPGPTATSMKTEAAPTETAENMVVKDRPDIAPPSSGTGEPNNRSSQNDNHENKDYVLGDDSTVTERMLKKVPSTESQTGGAGGQSTLEAFKRAEANWAKLKAFKPFQYDKKLLRWTQDGHGPPPQFVATDGAFGSPKAWEKLRNSVEKDLDYDVVVCGGTLGIFFAMYLQSQGHNVCVVEAGNLRGREQEWNISMDELEELKELGVLTQEDIDAVITTEFPACRSGFKNKEVTPLKGGYFENGVGFECLTPDVLNLGVAPARLLERVSERFLAIGGVIKEKTRLSGVCVSELVGSAIDLGEDQEPITTRLVLDCMGNASPISAQQRYGKKPDGICCVVGSCAGGYDAKSNLFGDIIYTNQPIVTKKGKGSNQYFWEAFPVGIGRGKEPGTSDVKTTYSKLHITHCMIANEWCLLSFLTSLDALFFIVFTYMDADQNRPALLDMFEDYWRILPEYQPSIQDPEADLDIKRILFAYFPTYKDSPLKPEFSRVLAVGDASGIQSPLSFGGFGALTRHLGRVGGAISEALENDCLHKDDLARINDYQPNLSAAWMFQKAMSVKMNQSVHPEFVNRLLATNFEVMDKMGEKTIRPFLQDVVRFDGLVGSLARSFVADPTFMPSIIGMVGVPELVKWLGHLGQMGTYSLLDSTVAPLVKDYAEKYVTDPRKKFELRRATENWKYGSGNDYKFPEDEQ
jgi:flavin-dependent dehydrogenase